MRRIRQFCLFIALPIIAIACSTSSQTADSRHASNSADRGFENILVIGVADDYNGRSRFERDLATELETMGASATPYYLAVGGNKPIDRKTIEQLVAAEGFDAVLITKVLNRETSTKVVTGSSTTKAVRKAGGAVDLFRYEYQELNEPTTLDVRLSISISSELFATSDGHKAWAIETGISARKMTSQIVDEAVSTISRRLKKDRMIGR